MNIFAEAKKLGVEIAHWCSDLYIPITPETTRLVAAYEHRSIVTTFTEYTSGKTARERKPIRAWYDIPFAYQPFWDEVDEACKRRKKNGH